MNYYPHHIGDFNSATRHLTRVERSLYRDLIELYYDTEQPLPADDFDRLARRVIANSEEEKEAMRYVLDEFFTLDDDVYRHERCDEEIAKYHAQIEAKSKAGKASARSRQAKKSTKKPALNKQDNNTNEQPLSTCSTHEQLTKNQEPRTNIPPNPQGGGELENAKVVLDYLNLKTGRAYRPVSANTRLVMSRLKDGATIDKCKAVIDAKVRQWNADDKMREFLRPATLFNRTNFEQYVGQLGSSSSGSGSDADFHFGVAI